MIILLILPDWEKKQNSQFLVQPAQLIKMISDPNENICGLVTEDVIPVNDTAAFINDAVLVAVNVPFCVFAILSNLVVIVAVVKKPVLHKPCYMLLCSLAFADCLSGVIAATFCCETLNDSSRPQVVWLSTWTLRTESLDIQDDYFIILREHCSYELWSLQCPVQTSTVSSYCKQQR